MSIDHLGHLGHPTTRPATAPSAGAAHGRWRCREAAARLIAFACDAHARYQCALFRIGLSGLVLAYLLREWPHRRVLYGDRSPWALDLAARLVAENHAFTVLTWSAGRWWFECVYHGAILVAALLMLGWRTRATSVLFLIAVLSLQNRNPLIGDGGDNVIGVMAIYLAFTQCGTVWSLDARRARRNRRAGRVDRAGFVMWQILGVALLWVSDGFQGTAWAAVLWAGWVCQGLWYAARRWSRGAWSRELLDAAATMLHNCAMLVIAAQICLIYATAGWYKVQGTRWQDGSGLHYALHLDYFSPWPGLGSLLASHMLLIVLLSYGTVVMQVAFPFLLGYRRLKTALLAVMILEHAGIAVLLGLPFLSAAMVVCDAVFLPTALLRPSRRSGSRPKR
ncbi:HTTM domain-containing protein [Streptomyces asiaticus]